MSGSKKKPKIRQALDMVQDAVIGGGMSIIVLHTDAQSMSEQGLSRVLNGLSAPLSKNNCALLFLISLPPTNRSARPATLSTSPLSPYAFIRLLIQRERWLEGRYELQGYEAQVRILKNRLHGTKSQVGITVKIKGHDFEADS